MKYRNSQNRQPKNLIGAAAIARGALERTTKVMGDNLPKDGGPFHAVPDGINPDSYHAGVRLREHFAGLAMQGLCSNSHYADWAPGSHAIRAVQAADALIKELQARGNENE